MKMINIPAVVLLLAGFGLALESCQKMERPELKELILDPPPAPPPPYQELKDFWSFENNLNDAGENGLTATGKNITYVAGVTGQAAKIGTDGYILLKTFGDTTKYPNGYKGLPADTLANIGSYTISFWMNGVGPVKDGAQGLFAIANKTEFWGNVDMFLENNDNGSEGFLKVHMFNWKGSTKLEQWNEIKIPNMLNKWTHIVVRYDGTTSKLSIFKDGQPTGINDKLLTDATNGNFGMLSFHDFNGMVLGTYQFQTTPSLTNNHGAETWAKSFNGALDQFRIYDRPLTNAEITDLFTTKK